MTIIVILDTVNISGDILRVDFCYSEFYFKNMSYITYANTNNASSTSVCPVCMGRGTLLSGVKTEQGYIATTTPISVCSKCHGIGYVNLYWGGAIAI